MKLHYISRFFKSIIVALLFCSCASDLDFNQADNLKIEPVLVANLTYLEAKANDFIDNGAEHDIVFDAVDFDVFRNNFLKDNLVKAQFDFEVENTIRRDFIITFAFLDANNQITHNTTINAPAYAVLKHVDFFENQTLDLLKNSVKLEIKIAIQPGNPITNNSEGHLKLRSGATLNFEIK